MSVLGVVLLASCPPGWVRRCLYLAMFSRDRQSLFAVLLDGASLSVLEARPWVLFIIVGFSRLHTWVRLYRFALERDWARRSGPQWHCGATPVSRNFTLFEPFAHGSHFATCGSSLSSLGISRFAASLSVIDFSILGASVSFSSFHGLGASLAVFIDSCPGSSVALRSARWSTPTVCGLWTSSTLREKGLGSAEVGILWLSLFSCEVLVSVQLDRAAALPLWSWASMGCLSIID